MKDQKILKRKRMMVTRIVLSILACWLILLPLALAFSGTRTSSITGGLVVRRSPHHYYPFHLYHAQPKNPNPGEDDDDDDDRPPPRKDNNKSLEQQQKENTSSNDYNTILSRFTNPRIDDPALPLADVVVAQVIAPSLQVFWLALNHAPSPTWLRPLFESSYFTNVRGALVAPALIHGAALAVCWVMGALAARSYEIDALVPSNQDGVGGNKGYGRVVLRVAKAGAFATGLLILATQFDLFWEFGGRYVQYGDGEQTDFRIQVAAVELINDVFFEAVTILTWRLYLAFETDRNSG
jgi:hypothetical protein